jgi:predicted nucleic acid-binding Zn ribbon protein
MVREQNEGECESCGRSFRYYLVHSGFNDSAYVHCDRCGRTLFLEIYSGPYFP